MGRKIYFGGSFFPPHKAHFEMIQQALQKDKEAELWIVPTKQNPLKESPGASLHLIQAWMEDLAEELSFQLFSRCVLELSELNSEDNFSYTSKTISELSTEKKSWTLLLGSDTAQHFSKWKNTSELTSYLHEVWVVPRGAYSKEQILAQFSSELPVVFLNPVCDISSTEIRDGTTSQPLEEFLSPHVLSTWKQVKL
jgi:nicotinate-nucleotide adenylyltransferase